MKAPKNDKKQIAIVGVLVLVMLGVGAFQFMGSSSAPAPAPVAEEASTTPTEGSTTADAQQAAEENPYASSPLNQRDPFTPQISVNRPNNGTTVAQTPTPPRSTPSMPPMPEMPPMPGEVPALPQVDGSMGAGPTGEITGGGAPIEPVGPSFRLSGVVVGDRPIALIAVDGGKQRAVRVGDQLAGHRVTMISRDKVVLVANGQRMTLALKGNEETE